MDLADEQFDDSPEDNGASISPNPPSPDAPGVPPAPGALAEEDEEDDNEDDDEGPLSTTYKENMIASVDEEL